MDPSTSEPFFLTSRMLLKINTPSLFMKTRYLNNINFLQIDFEER